MTTDMSLLTRKLSERLEEFMRAGRTGTVELNIKEGSLLAWKITEHGNG